MPNYRDPGTRITQVKNTSYTSGGNSFLPICVVADGLSTIKKIFKLVKTADDYNAIIDSDGDAVSFASIIRIGNTKLSKDYNITGHLTDYSLDNEVINSVSTPVIRWGALVGDVTPAVGDVFYAEVEVTPSDKHYDVKIMSSPDDVEAEYGADVVDGKINPITLAAKIALENCPLIYTVKVKKAGTDATAAEFQTALDKTKEEGEVYRVISVSDKADINLKTLNHIRLLSDPEEGKERVSIFSAEHASTTIADVITNVGGYAAAMNEFRANVIYPDKATRVLSDGNEYTLHGGYIAVALAAQKSSGRPEDSYTGMQITNFNKLSGVKFASKGEKNILAAKGVMILEQGKAGYPIEVRHGLSTDMSSLQMQESSVTEIGDYVSRSLRPALKGYKGKNITPALITQIKGSVSSVLSSLMRNNHILEGSTLLEIYQVETSPDTIAIKIRIMVPYPCNYIDVVIVSE